MNITKKTENLPNSAVELTVTIAKDDVSNAYNELLKKTAKNIQLPGFRKGKTPTAVLQRKYGEALLKEVAGDLVNDSLNEIFSSQDNKDIRPYAYSQPNIKTAPVAKLGEDLIFTVDYDVYPKIQISDYGVTIKEPQVQVEEKDIQNELKAIQERNALVMDAKDGVTVAKDHIVTVDFFEQDKEGKEIAGTKRQDFTFTVGSGQNIYKIDDDIVGMKKGDTKTIEKTYSKEENNAELAGTTKMLSVTVTAIKVRDLPKIDDDLAQDVSDKYKTLEDLKKAVKKNLETALKNKIDSMKSTDLVKQLVEKNNFELPKSMVQAEKASRLSIMAEQYGISPQQMDSMMKTSGQTKEQWMEQATGDVEQALKSRIVINKLLEENNISVTPEEVEEEYKKIADDANSTVEEVKKHYSDARAKEYMIDEMKERKLYDLLYKKVTVSKGDKVSFEKLFERI